ncbi:unnamed protein product [Mytilus edulis]|uniref:Reverse transcriptase domain-containing protein n=1 Tax=Mytilus edulis TaxID=6550 RepID=A0A8S3RWS4_MYTED|nr:unnamed protein product [Mytilus edulis]
MEADEYEKIFMFLNDGTYVEAMAQVLKPNCSLAGKSLIPIILRVKNADAEAVLELSRLKKDEPLESLTKVELIAQFEKLTGESVKDVLIVLCGKDDNIENVRLLVHESILLANSVGARGQRLSTSNPSTDTPAAKGSDGKAAQGDPSTTNQQLQAMRQDLDELKKNSKVLQVDEALSYVRTLAARPKLTTPGVLLAAIEMLVDAANKANHKDCSLFSKSFSMCKKYEDNVDFCGLVLKLFGSQEDKKISSLISDWAKSKKYEEPSGSKERQDILDAPPTSAPAFPFPGYGYQNPGFGFPYPNFYPGPNYNSGGFRPPRMQGGRGRRVSNGNIRDHEPLAKKEKFEPEIPDWELKSGFDPLSVKLRKQSDILLVNYKGEITQPSDCLPSAEEVVNGSDYDFEDLSFLDPNFFKAGNLMYCSEQWEKIGCPGEILDWIKQGVDIRPMFKHFKGNFRGRCYDSSLPKPAYFQNSASCKGFEKFLCDTLLERIANGSLTVIGRVGECDPPLLVLPITIEPSKPRMCHDERYLNLWIKDFPFSLDTLKEVPRLIEKDSFMASLDDKSGYDHILLNPNSRQYFGIQFAGWYMVFNSLPFGFKASAFIYHTTGLVPISYCRSLGVPSLLYIDDRLVCEFKNTSLKKKSGHAELNGVPRVWLPAEQCLVCGYANDVGYQFCQSCGQNPVLIESSERITSNCSVERRLRYLDSLVGSTSYNKKKLSLEKEFEKFLFGGEPVKCLKTASPLDVRRFMVMKDSRGKTQVHDLTCEFLGKLGIHSCQCPLRLAAGTVQSMLGQLKAIFESNGRGSEWNEITKIGNPVCSPEVDKYLHAIQFEQSKSHVVQKQAKPLFLDKLRSISVHIDDLLLDPVLKSSERFIFLRDQAFFKVQYFSGDRANDLGLCISQEVKLLPNGDGFLFSHTVGITLGKGKVNEFSILRFDDTLICPVKALERYVEGARALGVDLRFGYLFRTLSKNRKDVTDNPVSSNAMYDRLRKYLKKLDIYDGETPHGIRGACAITLAL